MHSATSKINWSSNEVIWFSSFSKIILNLQFWGGKLTIILIELCEGIKNLGS
jgi:hypothetical protein